jgi:hypothetical protein
VAIFGVGLEKFLKLGNDKISCVDGEVSSSWRDSVTAKKIHLDQDWVSKISEIYRISCMS